MNIEPIWSEYQAGIKAFLHSRISNPAEVDDLLQDILIKTYNNLHTIQSESSIKPWLFQIANRAIIDFYRERSKGRSLDAEDLWYEKENENIREPLSQCVEPFIKALPAESAELLTAIDLLGESQKACAEQLGISYSTLKSRVQKSRAQLKTLFEECCHFSMDHQGNLMNFDSRSNQCKKC